MLLRYIVSNFKSIGHELEFSMFPSEDNSDDRFLKTIHTKAGNWNVLRRGGFWGPNASGKSSFIQSIKFAKDFIINGQKSGTGTGVNQFKGDFSELEGKSSFQFMFYQKDEVYEYGFTLDPLQVFEEWLTRLDKEGFVPLFSRITSEQGETEIEIEDNFALPDSKERTLAETLKESIRENQKNQLFLYKLFDNGNSIAEDVIDWFEHIQLIFPHSKFKALPIRMNEDKKLQEYIRKMLQNMDTGVSQVIVEEDDIDFYDLAEKIDLPKEIVEDIEKIKNGIVRLNGKYYIFSDNEKKRTRLVQIKFSHLLNHISKNFDIDEESDGTQRLLDLLPALFSIGKSSNLYFVDEIDRSLHTKLSQFLLSEFVSKNHDDSINQLVFTAHDVNLINLNHFRQDEIWFIEKKNSGESTLRPFSDFTVKEGQDTLKAYLNGRFGAVPRVREAWEEPYVTD